jgi:hypothetical protein
MRPLTGGLCRVDGSLRFDRHARRPTRVAHHLARCSASMTLLRPARCVTVTTKTAPPNPQRRVELCARRPQCHVLRYRSAGGASGAPLRCGARAVVEEPPTAVFGAHVRCRPWTARGSKRWCGSPLVEAPSNRRFQTRNVESTVGLSRHPPVTSGGRGRQAWRQPAAPPPRCRRRRPIQVTPWRVPAKIALGIPSAKVRENSGPPASESGPLRGVDVRRCAGRLAALGVRLLGHATGLPPRVLQRAEAVASSRRYGAPAQRKSAAILGQGCDAGRANLSGVRRRRELEAGGVRSPTLASAGRAVPRSHTRDPTRPSR